MTTKTESKGEAAAVGDALEQIVTVCRDNAAETCNHRMALDFVHQVAAKSLRQASPAQGGVGDVVELLKGLRFFINSRGIIGHRIIDWTKRIDDALAAMHTITEGVGSKCPVAGETAPINEANVAPSTTTPAPEGDGWRDISTAPKDGTEIIIKTAGGAVFAVTWAARIFMDSEEKQCGGWVAKYEDLHPPCWTDGACWESNEYEERSDWPKWWSPLPAKPTGEV